MGVGYPDANIFVQATQDIFKELNNFLKPFRLAVNVGRSKKTPS